MNKLYTVTLKIEVTDQTSLFDAAIMASSAQQDFPSHLGSVESPNLPACIEAIYHPSNAPPGTIILESIINN